jgi:glycosyltransferase involved in cell wall biosynthesis
MGRLPVQRWIYYCVDDFSQWPGLDQDILREMEEKLVDYADSLIAVSPALQAKLAGMGRAAELLTHGIDLDFWQSTAPQPLPSRAYPERPWIVFWGVIDERLDVRYLQQLAAEMTQGSILLAGPEVALSTELRRLPRLCRLGPLAYQQLPALAQAAAVLIMPYADLPVTQAFQPLKLKEYLATRKPVVVRDLPATRYWADCLDLANSPTAFASAVLRRLQTGVPADQLHHRQRLGSECWDAKARFMERILLRDSTRDVASRS